MEMVQVIMLDFLPAEYVFSQCFNSRIMKNTHWLSQIMVVFSQGILVQFRAIANMQG